MGIECFSLDILEGDYDVMILEKEVYLVVEGDFGVRIIKWGK